MKGPSQAAVLAHTSKILLCRPLFVPGGAARPEGALTSDATKSLPATA